MKSDYSIYKPLRNKIRKYNPESVILQCVNKIHEISKKPIYENTGYLPWELLFLIKFVALDGKIGAGLIADNNTLPSLLNLIKDNIGNSKRFMDTGEPLFLNKFMRRIAFQQFHYQFGHNKADFGRQIYFFKNVEWKYPINEKFKEITGVKIEEYIEISFVIWTIFAGEKVQTFVDKVMLKSLVNIYGNDVLDAYLGAMSLDADGLKKYVAGEYEKCGDIEQQYYEQTPLKTYPLLKIGYRYYCYSPYVLKEKIKNFMYDILKANDSVNFSNEFGYKFEDYIHKCLKCLDDKLIVEKTLKGYFPGSKVVDFVLLYEDCTVFMEVKAIELSPDARVNPTNLILNKRLETSIIKSFRQIYSFANTIEKNKGVLVGVNSHEYFALIVTYKELYLGRGQEAWDEFIFEAVKDFLEEREIDLLILPPTNIFFVSVEALGKLVGYLSTGKKSLPEILRQAVIDDADPKTRTFLFEMHFKEEIYDLMPFVKNLADEYIDGIIGKIKSIN